jgi:hypothetical protein
MLSTRLDRNCTAIDYTPFRHESQEPVLERINLLLTRFGFHGIMIFVTSSCLSRHSSPGAIVILSPPCVPTGLSCHRKSILEEVWQYPPGSIGFYRNTDDRSGPFWVYQPTDLTALFRERHHFGRTSTSREECLDPILAREKRRIVRRGANGTGKACVWRFFTSISR